MGRGRTNLWARCEYIIIKHYEELKDEGLRGSYYMVREYLTQDLKQGLVSQEEFDKFTTREAYNTFCSDLWVSIEQSAGLPRPKAEEVGVAFINGNKTLLDEEKLTIPISARGFIYVEKGGIAEKLVELSKRGWVIITKEGFSTRQIRKLVKDDTRPLLVLHDCDVAGGMIYDNFESGSRRTSHLNLVKSDSIDLGLTWEDVEILDLAPQPEAPKFQSKKAERVELSALKILKARLGIQNPALSFVVAKMRKLGIPVAPIPEPATIILRKAATKKMKKPFDNIIAEIGKLYYSLDEPILELATNLVNEVNPQGEGVGVRIPSLDIEQVVDSDVSEAVDKIKGMLLEVFKKAKDELTKIGLKVIKDSEIVTEDEYDEEYDVGGLKL